MSFEKELRQEDSKAETQQEQEKEQTTAEAENSEEVDRNQALQEASDLYKVFETKDADLSKDRMGKGFDKSLLPARDFIRKEMAYSGLISKDMHQDINDNYGWQRLNRESLSDIKKNTAESPDSTPFNKLRGAEALSSEAVELEDSAMSVIGDCEKGWAVPNKFKEAFQNEIDNRKLKDAKTKLELEVGAEEIKPGFENLKKEIRDEKYKTFQELLNANIPEASPLYDWQRRMHEWINVGSYKMNRYGEEVIVEYPKVTQRELFDQLLDGKWMNSTHYAQGLESDLMSFRNRKLSNKEAWALQNLNKAEILGLVNLQKAQELRDKIDRNN
jgi:hypothetical protein